MKTTKNSHELYLKCDVLLLADVFEKFRKNGLKKNGLCPSHYLRSSGLSWNAMLKMTKIELEFPDPDLYIFFEKGIRVQIYYISNRYCKAKNKYLKSYDSKQDSKHIIYLDANSLHGDVMSKYFQTSGFKWIDHKEFNLNKHTSNSSKRYVVEVDLEYPK